MRWFALLLLLASLLLIACESKEKAIPTTEPTTAVQATDTPAPLATEAPPPTDIPAPRSPTLIPVVPSCSRAEVEAWAGKVTPLVAEANDIVSRAGAAGKTGDATYTSGICSSLEGDARQLSRRFTSLDEPPCAADVAETIRLVFTKLINGLGACKDGDFSEAASDFGQVASLANVAPAQLEQLEREAN
jgi:hypothetical protein